MNKFSESKIFLPLIMITYFIIALIGISINAKFPTTATDELAYLLGAGDYAGIDNTDFMKYNAYYGKGVSIFWSFFFPLFKFDSKTIYYAILVFNLVLIIGSMCIAIVVGRLLYTKESTNKIVMYAFVTILYPSNLYYAQTASTEIYLYFLSWLAFYFYIKIIFTEKTRYMLLFIVSIILMLNIHYRTIVLLLISIIIYILLVIGKKMRISQFVLSMIVLFLGYTVFGSIKDDYYQKIQSVDNITTINMNFDLIEILLVTLSNWKNLLIGVSSISYYLFIGMNLIFIIPVILFVRYIKQCYKARKIIDNNNVYVYLYLILIVGGGILATTAGLIAPIDRYDKVLYARYFDNLLGPLIFISLNLMTKIKFISSQVYMIIFIMHAIMFVVINKMLTATINVFAIDSSVVMGAFLDYYPTNETVVKGIIASYIVFLIMFYVIIFFERKFAKRVFIKKICMIVSIYWISISIIALYKQYELRDVLYQQYVKSSNYIIEKEPSDIIYVRSSKNDPYCTKAAYLQWMLLDKYDIKVIDSTEVVIDDYLGIKNKSDTMIICSSGTDINDILQGYYEMTFNEGGIIVYTK